VKVKTNPFDILNIRRVKFCPPNFDKVNLQKTYNIEAVLSEWIEDNLTGRYFLGENITIGKDDSIQPVTTVGFESEKEMSFFMLACPHLKYTR
jgi:hypothetical protein|tara:strand:- start:124 stop:402 length:279 start_codon:yes stop_codon:yes gene_type:complete